MAPAQFHRAWAAITRPLMGRYRFSIVAVEADWPDAAQIALRQTRGGERGTFPFGI